MRTGTIVFFLGILLYTQYSPSVYALWLYVLPAILVMAIKYSIFRWVSVLLVGILWAMFRGEFILAHSLEQNIEGKTILITGKIDSLPEFRERGRRFNFQMERLSFNQGHTWIDKKLKLRLNWYANPDTINPGETWQFNARLKRPYGFMNPGGFDYEGWLFQKRIRATGYILDSKQNKLLKPAPALHIDRLRHTLRKHVLSLPELPNKGLILALGLGDRSFIPEEHRRTLLTTGTNHLLAISGLHIGLVAFLGYFLASRLVTLLNIIAIPVNPLFFSVFISLMGACIYAAMAGFAIPTQRALIMLAVYYGALIYYRTVPLSLILSTALLIILIIDPFTVMSSSFWLSFTAIFFMYYGMSHRVKVNKLWWRWGRAQLILSIGLLPMLFILFHHIPFTGFPANLLAIPWVSFCVIPFVLAGLFFIPIIPSIAQWFFSQADKSLEIFWPILEIFQSWSPGMPLIQLPSFPVYILALIGILMILLPAGLPARWTGIVWLLPILCPVTEKQQINDFTMTLLDVGQGLAAVIQTRNHTLLYDTGARFNRRFNAGESVVIPFLKSTGINKLDRIIISHGDNDHIGGLDAVLSVFPVARILTSVTDRINHENVSQCEYGQYWQWDGVTFAVLSPDKNVHPDENNQSCVLKISQGLHSVLLTGDIEKPAEQHLLDTRKDQLSARILVAPHHGSKTSSMSAFVDAISPDYVLFPVGYRNRFNFPAEDIIIRYQKRGIKMLDSARHGAISIKFSNENVSIDTYRQSSQRFWHTRY